MSKISIALCTYNGANFLPAQLESFLRQTRLPDELIACDDCSDDATVEILREFRETAPFPVQVFVNEKNLGSTKNFERSIALCTGELIFLSDQDDVWEAEKINVIASVFDENKDVGLVFSDAEIVDENLRPSGRSLWSFTFPEKKRAAAKGGHLFEVLLSQGVVTGATMAFRANFRPSFIPIPDDVPHLIHDNWISLMISGQGAKVDFLETPLVKYRQHESQQLGLGLDVLETRTFLERKNAYAISIDYLKNEIPRLEKLSEIFDANPQLVEKCDRIDFSAFIEDKREQIRHLQSRMDLPSARIGRIPRVTKEILTGRYQRFSKGFLSAIKDLLEK